MTVLDRALLDALLFDWLEAGALAPPGHTAGDWRAFLDLCERLARERFLPAWKASDREEPRLDGGRVVLERGTREAVRAGLEAGLPLATVAEARGGMGLPFVVSRAGTAFLMAAHVAAAAFGMLSAANARLIRDHGTPAQAARFAAPQEEGRALGTMALSEPQAGSSLGDIRTRAEPDGADALGPRFRLRGHKMWISAAGHDATEEIVHLVLAKIPAPDGRLPEGTRGISLLIVPSHVDGRPNDLAVAGLNHKMGWRGTPNCALNLGERDGALGWLLGEPGQGLPIMFGMMNEARIGVGLGAAAQAFRGSLLARAYARERLQGRPPGERGGPMVPLLAHPDVRRMLLTQRALAEGALALCLFCARLVDRGDARSRALLDLLTPVAKTFPSEMGLESLSLGLQVHGGYGYTRDFDLEQLWRDSRLNPIHEGTTGIQGLDLAGRKLLGDGFGAWGLLMEEMAATEGRAGGPLAASLRAARGRADAALRAAPPRALLAQATPVLFAVGHLVVAWLWLDLADTLARKGSPQAEAAHWAARHFHDSELPRLDAWLAPLRAGSRAAEEAPDSAL